MSVPIVCECTQQFHRKHILLYVDQAPALVCVCVYWV